MSNSGEETELFALFDGFMNICFQGTEGSQQQVSEQKQSQQSQSNLTQPWSAHWKQFKIIISQRPINYHQFFTFISKIQENTSPSIVVSQQDTDSLSESSNQPSQLKNQQKAINPRTSAGPSIASSQNIFSFQSPVNNNINQHSGLINKASNNEAFLGTNIGMFKTAGGNLQSNMIKNNNNKKTNPATIQTQNTQNDINNHLLMSQKDHNIVNGQDPERKEGRINKENQSNQMNNLNGKPIVTDEQVESRNNNNTEKNTFNIYNTDISEQQSSQQQFQSQTSQQSPDKPSKKPSVLASHKSPQQQQPHPQSLHQSQNSTQNPRSGTQPPQNSINFTNYTNNQAKLISNNLRQVDSTGISQASTFVSSEKNTLFYLRNFSEFLRANTTIQSLGKNTQFENTSIVCLSNTTNSYLKLISINFFINLFKELPHPELSPNLTCQNSKHFLLEIINNVQSGSLILYLPHNSVLSIQQVTHAFISNIGLLLQLYFLYGQHPYKLATALIFQINNDPILLDSLISVVRALLLQQVHRSSNEIILSFFKIPDSAKKDPKINIDQILQEEKKQIIKRMKLQENWRIVNNEWLFLLSFALKRYIELFTLWENQLEQIIFAQLKLSEVATRNKINLFSTTPMDQKYQVTYLLLNNQQDKQIYATIAGTTMDKHGLRLDEEFNLKYVMKQIAKELDCKFPGKEQINSPVSVGGQDQVRSQIEKPKQPGVVINSNHHNQVQSEHQIGLDNINEGLIQSQQAYVSQGQQQQQNNNNNNNNNNRKPHTQTTLSSDQANKDYQTGHRIRQPGAQGNQQINQFQQQQQARMEASGRLSHGVKLQNPVQQQQQQPASQLNGLASPQIQKGTTATSPRIEGVGAPQRVSINNREDNIDWNKPALQTKLKDLLFTLNIHSEQLNSLGKFFISSAITNQQQPQQIHTQPNKQNEIPPFTKDMNQPVSSPMKLKSILNPLQPVEDNNIHNNNNNSNNNNSKHNNNNNTNSHNNTNNTQSSHGLSQASTKYASTLGSQPSNGLQQTNNMNSQIPNTTGIQGPQQNKQSFQQYQQQQQLQQQHQQLYSSNQYSNSQNERFKMFRSTNNNNTTSENNSQSNGYASNYHGGLGGMHASQNSNNISNQLNSNGGLFQQQQQYHSAFQNNQNINNLNGNGSINGQGNNAFKRPNSIEGTSKQQQQQQQQQQMYQQQQSQPMYSNQAQQYQQREITTKLSPRQQNNYNNNNNNNINPVSH